MSFSVYNSLTRSLESLELDRKVRWYTCGPTVYDHAHIGHARNYIMNDILRRILTSYGYQIEFAMNMTDIDDKIIKRSLEEKSSVPEVAERYERSFTEDMDKLRVLRPDHVTRVSQYVPIIIDYIRQIIENGYAYQVEGTANVYFDLQNYREKFSGNNFDLNLVEEEMEHHTEHIKRHPADFVLWKTGREGEPNWDSPWGKGRPGWHIECSAMASDVFGSKFDIHSGGIDLRFPHHENEFKQANAHNKTTGWVKYFFHIGHLHIEGLKMSKSLKNFITIKEILKRASPDQIRLLFLLHNYRQPMEYSEKHLEQAKDILDRLMHFFQNINLLTNVSLGVYTQRDQDLMVILRDTKDKVDVAIRNDFDLPVVIGLLQDLVKNSNRYVSGDTYQLNVVYNIRDFVYSQLTMFGLHIEMDRQSEGNRGDVLDVLCEFRDEIRKFAFMNKQFDLLHITDKIRDKKAKDLGVTIEDKSKTESVWKTL